jgi:hypothetical protein
MATPGGQKPPGWRGAKTATLEIALPLLRRQVLKL